jgi:TfoX N-terminal domain
VAYDEELADRLRERLQDVDGLTEKRMFGGLAFLVHGHMAVAASSTGGLLLRVDPAQTAALVEEPHAERFVMGGREMDGWLRIDPDGIATDEALARWSGIGLGYVATLPPKAAGTPGRRRRM